MLSVAARAAAVAVVLFGCNSVEGANRTATEADCDALCRVKQEGAGCDPAFDACHGVCVADAQAFGETCLIEARAYYQCAAQVAWSCPTASDRPETDDGRCDAEEHAWLVCKVTGG